MGVTAGHCFLGQAVYNSEVRVGCARGRALVTGGKLPSSPPAIATLWIFVPFRVHLRGGHEPKLGGCAGFERGAPSLSPDGSNALLSLFTLSCGCDDPVRACRGAWRARRVDRRAQRARRHARQVRARSRTGRGRHVWSASDTARRGSRPSPGPVVRRSRPGRSVHSHDLEGGRPVPPAATDKDNDCVVCISLIAPARTGRCRS